MTTVSNKQPTVEQLQACFQSAIENEPVYQKILPFFQSLYEMQTDAARSTLPSEINLSPAIVSARHTGAMPLIERGEITVDQASAAALLKAILTAAKSANPKLASAAEAFKTYVEDGVSRLARCHRMFLDKDRDGLQSICEMVGISAEQLDFFLYNSLWPSLASHTRRLSAEQAPNGDWSRGYCPICGALPKISYLAETGGRFLVCGFCRHAWSFKRIQCPFCSNIDTASMGYHVSDDNKAHRIDTCERCKGYIKRSVG